MTIFNYKKKLQQFNKSHLYQEEMKFMEMLIGHMDYVLDYGCGTGYMVDYFNQKGGICYGYDIGFKYLLSKDKGRFRDNFPHKFNHIYFMHSLAHISDIEDVLVKIKGMLTEDGKVHVITPNKLFLDKLDNRTYIPDPTVVKHFTPTTLEALFLKCNYNIEYRGQFGTIVDDQHERLFLTA